MVEKSTSPRYIDSLPYAAIQKWPSIPAFQVPWESPPFWSRTDGHNNRNRLKGVNMSRRYLICFFLQKTLNARSALKSGEMVQNLKKIIFSYTAEG